MAHRKAPAQLSLAETWQVLERGLDQIMATVQGGLSFSEFMELYTTVYNHLTQSVQTGFATGVFTLENNPYEISRAHANKLGLELYSKLQAYIRQRIHGLQAAGAPNTGESLLAYYSAEWIKYEKAARYIDHVFRYMNRYWCKRQREEGVADIYNVYPLFLLLWNTELFLPLQDKLISAALEQVSLRRVGKMINSDHIKDLASSLVSVSLCEADQAHRHPPADRSTPLAADAQSYEVYRHYFEQKFIAATQTHYAHEGSTFRAHHAVVEYMQRAEMWINDEEQWCELYLPQITLPLLRKTCNAQLIEAASSALCQEFLPLLGQERLEDLARLYRLLSRLPNGLSPLLQMFKDHVCQAGKDAMATLAKQMGATASSTSGADTAVDSKVYTDTLLAVHQKFLGVVNRALNSDSNFTIELDKACREFINRNSLCNSGTAFRSPELLARYTDLLLRKGSSAVSIGGGQGTANNGSSSAKGVVDEVALEEHLAGVMTVFKYIDDKDVFQKFYSKMLAKRLVNGTSVTEDAEASMISKLKVACGHEYTSKLQRMFMDISISRELYQGFKQWLVETSQPVPSFDYSMLVLGTAYWPLQSPTTPFRVPEEIAGVHTQFQKYYDTKHSGRNLNWLFQYSKAEVRTPFTKSKGNPVYTLQVSTYQLAILLLFNRADTWSFEAMQQSTNLLPDTLSKELTYLVKSRLLLVTAAAGASDGSEPSAQSQYTLNLGFKSRKVRLNLNIPMKSEQKQEVETTNKTVTEDRKVLIQAAIVRIMKTRRTMDHVQLMNEVIAQLQARFKPSVPDIKKAIDAVVDRDYIERIEGQKNMYKYLA
ncbi:ubiquitin ligase (cullin) of SCF [Dimargaris xerosporica]|nr:ubiquitin ligase (cullin) of SCF [Dimargaris xerosporica]